MERLATRIHGPVAAIGDVHGQLELLIEVVEQLKRLPDYDDRWLVFIGDYIDRGSDSSGVLDFIIDLLNSHPKTTAIAGNHDLALAAALEWVPAPAHCNWDRRWVDHYDSESTFESYGVAFNDMATLKAVIPDSHKNFMAKLPWCVEHPKYLFVHAGLDPNVPLETQLRILRQRDFSLSRPPWLCSKTLVRTNPPRDCRSTIVSGHEFVPNVQFSGRRILIDTTGGRQGQLSCALLPEKRTLVSSGQVS